MKRSIALAFAALSAVGCSHVTVDLATLTHPPRAVSISLDGISVPVGIAAGVDARVFDGDSRDTRSKVDIAAVPADVLGVDRTLDKNHFVLYGIRTGSATVEIYVDGDRVSRLPALVSPQIAEP